MLLITRECIARFNAQETDYALTVAARVDTDDEGVENFVLRLVTTPATEAANLYTLGDDIEVIGRITETPEVAFNIAARTTPNGEAFITEYWNRAVDVPFQFSQPLADTDNDAAITFTPLSEFDDEFSPLNAPSDEGGIPACDSTACSLVVDNYGTGDIGTFAIPITLSREDAGRRITLIAGITLFDTTYIFAEPTSVVISILAPNLAIGETSNFPIGVAEGGVMEFENPCDRPGRRRHCRRLSRRDDGDYFHFIRQRQRRNFRRL